jgi:predicted transcriptional regulator
VPNNATSLGWTEPPPTRQRSVQLEVFHEVDPGIANQPILMSLLPQYYNLIWNGEKHYEYRRRYIWGSSRWYVYLTHRVAAICGTIELASPIVASPLDIADIAEGIKRGHGESVWNYHRGVKYAYAMRILRVDEHSPIRRADLRFRYPHFTAPRDYVRLSLNPGLKQYLDGQLTVKSHKRSLVLDPGREL